MLRAMFDFLKPRWKKEARDLLKGAKKFVHYKRDLLKPDRIDEIESRRIDLREAMKRGDKEGAREAGKQLRATCEQSLKVHPKQNWWEENVEVLFVALVVALGLRAYVLQPFRIPTGSMQPTLNGIVIENQGDDYDEPWFGKQAWDYLVSGKSYKHIVAEEDKRVVALRDASWFLFTRTEVVFDNGTSVKIPSASSEVRQLVYTGRRNPETGEREPVGRHYEQGEPILKGTITSGDLVLVDKISYHFRKPERGEVFVFDTRAITTEGDTRAELRAQTGGSHYIKRLCGLPGDELRIEPPDLYINGRLAEEPTIRRVMNGEGEYGGEGRPGYILANHGNGNFRNPPLDEPGEVFKLKDTDRTGMREYAALGDNTASSLDSRYWGPVHEFNLSGPGWFSLWPFGSGHWGFIE